MSLRSHAQGVTGIWNTWKGISRFMADAWYRSPPLTMDINEPFSSHKAAVFFVQTVDIYFFKNSFKCCPGELDLLCCTLCWWSAWVVCLFMGEPITYTWERPNTHITDAWFKRAFGRLEVKHLKEPKKRSSFAFNSSVLVYHNMNLHR